MATRNAINVLIKLLGGAEMTAELKTLGTTGEAAIKKIDDAAKGVSFANLGGALHNFGSDITSTFERVALGIGAVSAAVSAAAPVVLLLAKSGAEAADAAGKAAAGAGLQAEAYQKLAFAAGESDVSQQNFNTAMNAFNKQITKTADETVKNTGKMSTALKRFGADGKQAAADITQGAGYTVQAFKDIGVEVTRFGAAASKVKAGTVKAKTGFDDLGIKVKDTSGKLKDGEKLLLEVANAFQKMPDGARKSAIALKLFGLEGAKLIPFLNEGAKGIQALEDEAARLGIVFSDEQIKAAEAFNTSLGDLKKTVAGVLRQIGLIFAPAITAGANAFKDAIVRNRAAILDFVRNGVQVATVFIKDFFATLSGRDADVTDNKWLITWRDNIVGFGKDFEQVVTGVVIPAMSKLRAAADLTVTAINGIFGTNLTSGEVLISATIFKLIGGFGLLRSAVVLVVEAIAFLSQALLLSPAGRIILAIAAALEVVIAVWNRERALQQGWIAGTDAHKNALNELKAAIDAVKAGVPGAEENLKRLAQAHLDSARAALADAKAQVDQQQQIVDAMKQGGEFAAPLGADIDTQTEALLRANINLAKSTRELDEIQKTLDGKVVGNIEDLRTKADAGAAGLQNAAAGAKDLGAAVDDTATKAQNLDHQISVFRGGGAGGQISKETFDVIDGVAHRADQATQSLDAVGASAKSAAENVKNVSSEVTNSVSAIPDAIKPDAAASAVDGIVTDVGKLAPAAQDAAGGVNDALATIDAGSAEQAATAVVTPFESLPGKISTIMGGLQSLIQGGFSSLSSIVSSLAAQINSQIASILSALREAAAAAANLRAQAASSSSSSSSSGGGSQGGFASGGHVRGAGGPTSDSILAMLSNGEFVMQAAAVKRLGVGFLNALNQGFLPSLKGLRGFSLGGAVETFSRSMAIPRFAGGGLAPALASGSFSDNARTPLVLQLPGGEQIDDLTIGNIALNKLQSFAIRSSLTTTGRKPRRG